MISEQRREHELTQSLSPFPFSREKCLQAVQNYFVMCWGLPTLPKTDFFLSKVGFSNVAHNWKWISSSDQNKPVGISLFGACVPDNWPESCSWSHIFFLSSWNRWHCYNTSLYFLPSTPTCPRWVPGQILNVCNELITTRALPFRGGNSRELDFEFLHLALPSSLHGLLLN